MTQGQHEDTLARIATTPERCLDCLRLIRPGDNYHQGKDNTVLCPTCHGSLLIGEGFWTVTTASGLAVDYGGGVTRVRREGAASVLPRSAGLLRFAFGVSCPARMCSSASKASTTGTACIRRWAISARWPTRASIMNNVPLLNLLSTEPGEGL